MAERKRQISLQQGRNPHNDGFEYDSCADPRHVAFLRNKRANELSKEQLNNNPSNESANNISPFTRIEKAAV